jgi:tetratricopeptide (TPR) repeat protein
LSVFPAPFDLAAAAAVLALPADAPADTEALLGCLLRRSLLDYDPDTDRYRLHDLLRVFAAARLPDADTVRWRHARHYATVARQADRMYLQGGEALMAGLALFDRERAHIDTAWEWVRAQAATTPAQVDPLLLAFAAATASIGYIRYDTRHERIPQLEAALAAARRIGKQYAEGQVLNTLGNTYRNLGEPRQAIGYYHQALEIARVIGERQGEGASLGSLGQAYADLGETRQAIGYYEQRLEIARMLADRRGEGTALGSLGIAYKNLGELEKAIGYCEQHLAITRALGDRRGEGQALGNLGNAYRDLGELERAIEYYEQSLVIKRAIGDRQGEAISSWNLGRLLEQQGDLERAVASMQVYVAFLQEIGHPDAEQHAAYLEEVRGRLAAGG